MRSELGVEEEWVKGFDPIAIIEIPEMGKFSAKFACEKRKIQGYKDHAKLNEAKDECYQRGNDHGVCILGAA